MQTLRRRRRSSNTFSLRWSETIKRYGAGALPKGNTIEDWPFGYDELEPYYDTIEYEVGVSGKAGKIQGKIDARGDVFEGPRRREYPMPPLRDTEFTDAFVNNKVAEWLRAAGAIEVITSLNNEGPVLSVHAVGGTRMGDSPETNVVNKWGFSHETPNLGILGGSVMPTHGARNPTLTIQALSWRTAEHLVKNWNAIAS